MTTTIDTNEHDAALWSAGEANIRLAAALAETRAQLAQVEKERDAERAMCEGAERAEREQQLRAEVAEEALAEHRSGAALVKALDRAEKAEAALSEALRDNERHLEALANVDHGVEMARVVALLDEARAEVARLTAKCAAYEATATRVTFHADTLSAEADALRAALVRERDLMRNDGVVLFKEIDVGFPRIDRRYLADALDRILAAKPEQPAPRVERPHRWCVGCERSPCACPIDTGHPQVSALGAVIDFEHDAPRVDSEAVASDAEGEG